MVVTAYLNYLMQMGIDTDLILFDPDKLCVRRRSTQLCRCYSWVVAGNDGGRRNAAGRRAAS
jgi:hypothetical protein